SVELTTRTLDRIARFNPKINAIVTLAGDAALARARAADEARARGEWWGPFHGVPCTVKDTFEVAGVTTTAGLPTLKSHVPARDAVVVARLRRARAVVLGNTPGPPGTPPGAPPLLPVAGPLARSAADLRAALEALGGPDEEEARAYRWSLAPARGTRLADYRIGFVLDDPACRVSSDVREVHAQATEALRRAGAKLEEGWPQGVSPAQQYDTYLYLLNSVFAFTLRDDQVEEMRRRA